MSQINNSKLLLGFLGLVLTAFLSSEAYAQSGSKYGSSKRNQSMASKRKMEREQTKLRTKLVNTIAKNEFGAVDLTNDQRRTLKGLVEEHFTALSNFDQQIGSLIPVRSQKALKKSYLMAKKEGQAEEQAMETSMMKVGISESVQTRVMSINQSKQSLMDEIRLGVVNVLSEEQKVALNKAMAAKKEMESEKEAMDKDAASQN